MLGPASAFPRSRIDSWDATTRQTSQAEAQQLADYLLTLGIETRVETHRADGTALWVYDENRVHRTAGVQEFKPAIPILPGSPRPNRKPPACDQEAARRKTRIQGRPAPRSLAAAHFDPRAPLTMLLLGASGAVGLWTDFGRRQALLQWLWLSNNGESWLPEVMHGEVWRLWTPMFVHYSLMHLLFNMYWLYVLGSVIEIRRGTLELFLLVFVSQLGCSLGESLVEELHFGGMSGVVYALFGYCWIKSRFDPRAGIYVDPQTIFLMVRWALFCLTGVMGPVAKSAASSAWASEWRSPICPCCLTSTAGPAMNSPFPSPSGWSFSAPAAD